jgi:hypothetical protein
LHGLKITGVFWHLYMLGALPKRGAWFLLMTTLAVDD